MKKLEELGISPAPWRMRETTGGVSSMSPYIIRDATGYILRCGQINNAHLITAAPKMYEALRELLAFVNDVRQSAWWLDAKFNEIMAANKVMTNAEAALAEASGESEVKKCAIFAEEKKR